MSVRHAIWNVGPHPESLKAATLASERLLEDMIVASPEILSDEWMPHAASGQGMDRKIGLN